MKLFLTTNRMLKGDSSLIGYCRENKCECLNIQVMDTSLWTKQAFLEFQLNENEKYTTEALDMTSGVINYPVPNGLLLEAGILKLQVVIRDGETVWKSSIKKFTIEKSICAGDDIVIEYPTGGGSNKNSLEVVDLSEYKYGDLVPQETMDKLVRLEEKVAIYYKNKMWYLSMKYDDSIKYHCNYVDGEDFSISSGDLYIDLTDGSLAYDEFENGIYNGLSGYFNEKTQVINLSGYKDGDVLPSNEKNKINSLGKNVLILRGSILFHYVSETSEKYFFHGYEVSSEHKNIHNAVLRVVKSTGKLEVSDYGSVSISSENKREIDCEVDYDEIMINSSVQKRDYVFDLSQNGTYLINNYSPSSLDDDVLLKFEFGSCKSFTNKGKFISKSSLECLRNIFSTEEGYSFGVTTSQTSPTSYFIGAPSIVGDYFFIKVTDDEVEVFSVQDL